MNSNAKYFIVSLLLLIGVAGVSFYSCEKEEIVPNETTPVSDPQELSSSVDNTIRTDYPNGPSLELPENHCGEYELHYFSLSNKEKIGKVHIYNDGKNLYFQLGYKTEYTLQKSYIHIAFDKEKIPVDKMGNPDVEKFRYQSTYNNKLKTYLIKVPLSDIRRTGCLIAFATDIVNNDDKPLKLRAWAGEVEIGETIKGRIMKYTVEPCLIDEGISNIVDQ